MTSQESQPCIEKVIVKVGVNEESRLFLLCTLALRVSYHSQRHRNHAVPELCVCEWDLLASGRKEVIVILGKL